MTALAKLFKTTAFKLSLGYLVIFGIGAAVVFGSVAWNVRTLIDEQIGETVDAELTGLAEQYLSGGIRRLVAAVERRAGQPGSSLYLVTTSAGVTLAGNVAELPDGVLARPGLVETAYQRTGEGESAPHDALARIVALPGGFRLLVGRDVQEREGLRRVMARALVTSLALLLVVGTLGGLFVARRVLARVDAISAKAQTILNGDLAGRLPVAGSGDELDRLTQNLNAMLERIGGLMTGLRDVSDNIAHDLRTPLTRLRAGAEAALRSGDDPGAHAIALEKVIAESEGLIRVFDALLMIARAEAGSGQDAMQVIDVGTAARDVGELYEPAAEEVGGTLDVEVEAGLAVRASRELVGQAIANLVDNALKYGAEDGTAPAVTVFARRVGGMIEIGVGDRGPGIDAADRARVLDRFVRLEGSRSRPGSGLGLSLAAAVAGLHHGEIRIEDNEPGLRVVIALPAADARGLPAPPLRLSAPTRVDA